MSDKFPRSGACFLRVLIAVGAALSASPGVADDGDSGVISLIIENDSFDGGDSHYTSGGALSWQGDANDTPEFAKGFADWAPFFPEGATVRPTLAFGQKIFTPRDTEAPALQPNDRPYAGYLFFSGGLIGETEDGQIDQFDIALGVVGPAALGEEVQTLAHTVAGFDSPAGWENQIQNEFAVQLTYQRSWRGLLAVDVLGLGADFTPHVGGALGNVYTYANAGGTVRLGFGLDQDQGLPRLQPGATDNGSFTGSGGLGAYAFAGVDGRAVAQNIFLDGNTFHDGPSVDKKPFVADFQIGAAVTIDNVRLGVTQVYRTKEFEGQDEYDSFSSVSLSLGL